MARQAFVNPSLQSYSGLNVVASEVRHLAARSTARLNGGASLKSSRLSGSLRLAERFGCLGRANLLGTKFSDAL